MHDLEGNCKPQANYNYASVVWINKTSAAVSQEKQTSHDWKQIHNPIKERFEEVEVVELTPLFPQELQEV